MSEKVENVNTVNTNEETKADIDAAAMECKVENGKIVYTKSTGARKNTIGSKIKKGFARMGYWVKQHPVGTILIGGGLIGGGIAAEKLYEAGHGTGFAEGYSVAKKEAEQERLAQEQEEQAKLEEYEVSDIEPVMDSETGEVVG